MYPCKKSIVSLGLINILPIKCFIFCGMMGFPLILFSQSKPKSQKEKPVKHIIGLETGLHFNHNYNNTYIGWVYSIPSPVSVDTYYSGTSEKPSNYFHIGFDYTYVFTEKIRVVAGFLYFNRRTMYVTNTDSLFFYTPDVVNPTVRKEINPHNIDFFILGDYKVGRFNFFAGTKIKLKTIYITKEKRFDGSEFKRKGHYSEKSNLFYPTVRCSIDILRKKSTNPAFYAAVDRRSSKNYDFQFGFLLPLKTCN